MDLFHDETDEIDGQRAFLSRRVSKRATGWNETPAPCQTAHPDTSLSGEAAKRWHISKTRIFCAHGRLLRFLRWEHSPRAAEGSKTPPFHRFQRFQTLHHRIHCPVRQPAHHWLPMRPPPPTILTTPVVRTFHRTIIGIVPWRPRKSRVRLRRKSITRTRSIEARPFSHRLINTRSCP